MPGIVLARSVRFRRVDFSWSIAKDLPSRPVPIRPDPPGHCSVDSVHVRVRFFHFALKFMTKTDFPGDKTKSSSLKVERCHGCASHSPLHAHSLNWDDIQAAELELCTVHAR